MMDKLIAELEAATEGNRKLDEAIAFQMQWRPETVASKASFASHERKHDYATAWIAHALWRIDWPIPAYTTSLDAALTLAPEGWGWLVRSNGDGAFANLTRGSMPVILNALQINPGWQDNPTFAPTPALALCIAALKARQALEAE